MVSHTSAGKPCWRLLVAENSEKAVLKCFKEGKHPQNINVQRSTCKVEEVKIKGYKITVTKESE